MNKIWVLFSIANMYDQPDNNLVAWWHTKPTFEILAKALGITYDKKLGNSYVGNILKGKEIRIRGADYRLEEIGEG